MQRPSRSDRAAWWLFIAALTLSFVLSPDALMGLGIPYDAPFGPAVAKLHPGTYTMLVALMLALLRHGNPLQTALLAAWRQPALAAYLGCMVTVFVWSIVRHGSSGAAYIVQTLWMPGLALLTLSLLSPERGSQTLRWLLALLCVNAGLALLEFAGKFHLMPLSPLQKEILPFRATALLGHPLANACITVGLLPAVVLMPWRIWQRVAAAVLLLCSVLAFGARTALAVAVAVYGAQLLLTLLWRALRGRYSYLQLTGGSLLLLLGPVLLTLLALGTGLGERIFKGMTWDNSANVRLRAWEALDFLSEADWWLGLSPLQIDGIVVAMGLDPRYEAIENFWIYALLQFGIVGFTPFVIGLACLVGLLLARCAPVMASAVLVFFVVASTANTLTSKSVALTFLAVVLWTSAPLRPRRQRRDAPADAATPEVRAVVSPPLHFSLP